MTEQSPQPPNNNRSLLSIMTALVLAIVAGAVLAYSMWTSQTIDKSAISAGSSTSPKAPNTIQDQPERPPSSTTGSNVPPAGPSSR